MKILLVSCTLPPDGSATAGLINNLCEQFSKMGHQVDGITVKKSMYDQDKTSLHNGTVYYANYVHVYKNAKKQRKFRDLVFSAYKKIYLKFHRESKLLYSRMRVNALVKAMKKRCASQYDTIIAACAHYDAIEAVMTYVNKYGYSGKVGLYQVDPLRDNVAYFRDGIEYLADYEMKVVRSCDYIVTTPIIFDARKDDWNHPCVIPVEFPAIVPRSYDKPEATGSEVKCVFAGSLHRQLRNPKFALELFSRFANPKIHFYVIGSGFEDMLTEYANGALAGRLHFMGQLDMDDCNRWLEKADVLVNIGNSVANMTPSKIFTYISYGKPILNFVKVDDCPAEKYMQRYPLSINVREVDNLDEIDVLKIENWLLSSSGLHVDEKAVADTYLECTPAYVAKKIISLIEK